MYGVSSGKVLLTCYLFFLQVLLLYHFSPDRLIFPNWLPRPSRTASKEEYRIQTTTVTEKQNAEFFSQEHLHLIYRYVYSYMRNRQEAEDLTSQIFLKAVRRLDLEQSAHSHQAYLFQVARTTIIDYWRAHYRRAATHSLEALVEAGWEGPAEEEGAALLGSAAAERVQALLQSLPAR